MDTDQYFLALAVLSDTFSIFLTLNSWRLPSDIKTYVCEAGKGMVGEEN